MKNEDNRRTFVKTLLVAGAGFGIFSSLKFIKKSPVSKKTKMLTPEGKLVEVDLTKIEHYVNNTRATDEEIKNWMKTGQY